MSGKINHFIRYTCISGLCILILSSIYCYGQSDFMEGRIKDPMSGVVNRVYVQRKDSVIETHYYRGDKNISTKPNLLYYWYAAQDIKHTRGSFEGKLLHGSYVMFYYNKDLKEKGSFRYGLKDGKWENWYQGGEIKSREQWKSGLQKGKSQYYYENGTIHQQILFKKGSKSEVLFFDEMGNKQTIQYFKNNILIKEESFERNKHGKIRKERKLKKAKKVKPDKVAKVKKTKSPKGAPKVKEQKKKKTKGIKVYKFKQILPAGKAA